jgi:hypothetical protein
MMAASKDLIWSKKQRSEEMVQNNDRIIINKTYNFIVMIICKYTILCIIEKE